MGLKFYAVKRKVPSGVNEGQERYYGQIVCEQPVALDTLCRQIADQTSVTRADVLVVIDGFTKVVCAQLRKGNIVELGDLGNVRVTAGSTGAESVKKFKAWMMKKGRVTFTPGKALCRVCNEVPIEKMKVNYPPDDCPLPHVEN